MGADTGATSYTYNLDRQLTQVTRPDARTIALAYDTGGRLNTRTIQRGTTSYAYDGQTGIISSITAPDAGVLLYYDRVSANRYGPGRGRFKGTLGLLMTTTSVLSPRASTGEALSPSLMTMIAC